MSSKEAELTPKKIIEYLDKFIIGQAKAKRSIAIALRNRWRRKQVPEHLQDEIIPKNIIMIGATGVGKTEIARRIAKLVNAPFIKVEASKYTEVGYVGRDVESMVRDLVEISMNLIRKEKLEMVQSQSYHNATERVANILFPPSNIKSNKNQEIRDDSETQKKILQQVQLGKFDEKNIEIETMESSSGAVLDIIPMSGNDNMDLNIRDMMKNFIPKSKKKKQMKVKDAIKALQEEEAQKLIDKDSLQKEAIEKVQDSGIIFLDEIDKIAVRSDINSGDVSREGVQRDLLPIVEGSTINTKYGPVDSDHILFIAAGAFHQSKPADLIPELQGRFPIRVELDPLSKEDFKRILLEPDNSLIKQYTELLKTEDVTIHFSDDAIDLLSENAFEVNSKLENIGARRLHTLLEKLLDDISFEASEMPKNTIKIDANYVKSQLEDLIQDQDLNQYIL